MRCWLYGFWLRGIRMPRCTLDQPLLPLETLMRQNGRGRRGLDFIHRLADSPHGSWTARPGQGAPAWSGSYLTTCQPLKATEINGQVFRRKREREGDGMLEMTRPGDSLPTLTPVSPSSPHRSPMLSPRREPQSHPLSLEVPRALY